MKIAVSSWSMHRDFFQGNIKMVDFIRIAKEVLGWMPLKPFIG